MSGEIQELGNDGRHFIKEDVSGPPDPRSPSFPPPHPGSGAPASLVPAAPWPPCSAPSLGLPLPCQHLSSLPDWRARDLTLALTPCSPEPSSAQGHQPPAASSGLPSRHLAVLFPSPQTGPPPCHPRPGHLRQSPGAGKALSPPQPPRAAHPVSSRTISRFQGTGSPSSPPRKVSPAPACLPSPPRLCGAPGTPCCQLPEACCLCSARTLVNRS